MAKGDKKGSGNENSAKVPVTKDDRFKSVHNDPRFNLPNLKNFKVKIDDRFSKKELKKLNAGAGGKTVKIDRYGRKLKKSDSAKALEKFYEHDEEDEEHKSKSGEESEDSESEESEESDSDNDNVEVGLDRARGEGLESSSDESSEEESESESDSEEDIDELDEDSEIEVEQGKPDEGEPSSRFAVVNMDWDNLKAVDLMATFISFVPSGGSIKSITIYPSEFGKEQMQKEEIEGPPRDLFKSSKNKKKVESDSDSDDEIDVNSKEDLERAARKLYEEDNGEEDYDSKALRRYQLQRLRYFYAVVTCDSVGTSKNIYDNCDGTEYESTANIFDLRYIPEDMEFDDSEAKDSCSKIPSSYRPDSGFVTDALQHSKVKLTWDETPKDRLTLSSRPLSQKEIDEMDFKAYLASDTDESETEDVGLKNKYKNLLGGSFGSFGKGKDEDEDEDDVDMEITFDPGLKDTSEVKEEQKEDTEETTIDAYRRKEKERRKKRLAKMKETQEVEKEEKEEKEAKASKNNKKNNKKSKKSNEVDEKSKAELELLMMDDENNDDHFNMKDVIKAEKQKSKKNKKSKSVDSEFTQDNFEADLNDPRFKEIFESHDYAIDPTNSEFKKTETMKKILTERSKRNRDGSTNYHNKSNKRQHKDKSSHGTKSTNNEVGSLVNKIKSKYRKN
ncbi:uncharacterized protein RJT21DRAFT_19641 [Scheffersomyces amazonensis]|uniref:uncharacterized protein n=1 Tax=Scheffersomyces amazonensis TaxID=1078765 RepID=UPI00315DD040